MGSSLTTDGLLATDRLEKLKTDPIGWDRFLQRIGNGETLREVCRAEGLPYSKMVRYLEDDTERWTLFNRALKAQAMHEVDEALEIADGRKSILEALQSEIENLSDDSEEQARIVKVLSAVNADTSRDKLRVETRFKRARFHAPERYGEKAEVASALENLGSVLERISERKRAAMLEAQKVVSEQ